MERDFSRGVSGRGFTLVELIVVVCVVAVVAGVVVLGMSGGGRRHGHTRSLKDSTQVRGMHQGLIAWAQSNGDEFPLPSLVDVDNATVADIGAAKDHTANIFSMLVFNGTISTEILISPAEASGSIRLYDGYEFDKPAGAVDPAKALWDPALSADFTSAKGGHISYATVLPSGARLPEWSNTFNQSAAILGNRGPKVAGVKQGPGETVTPVFADPASITFLIHGSRTKWEGNVAFNDNHVEFLTKPKAGTYQDSGGVKREDILFFDEPDDPTGTNHFMGIFIKAGATPREFKAIWD